MGVDKRSGQNQGLKYHYVDVNAERCIWSGSALFGYVPQKGRYAYMG